MFSVNTNFVKKSKIKMIFVIGGLKMKKTFISFIVALSLALYSAAGFTAFADILPNEDNTSATGGAANGAAGADSGTGQGAEPRTVSFDGTNADGTIDISNGVSTNLTENGSKYNGMASTPIDGSMAQSRYSNVRVALAPDIADTKYAEAAELLGALGIMVGDAEDGAFRPDDPILRSEMAKVAVYSIGLEDVVQSSNGTTKFPDVPSDHWATGAINVADQNGMVIGDSEGTFRPDDSVTFEEAVAIIVRALGYEPAAEDKGGFPTGYMLIASSNQLLRGIDAASAEPAKRGDIAQLVFNALTVNLMEQVGYGSETRYEVVDKTLLYDRLNVEKAYGQITGTDETSLSGGSTTAEDRVQIGDKTYIAGDTTAAQFLGYNVLYYARIDKATDEKTLILVTEQRGKNNTLTLNSTDIVSVVGDSGADRTVEYWADRENDRRTRTTTITKDAVYIYNGKYKSDTEVEDLMPESGNMVLLDSDVNGVYDIVFVNHFKNLVVDTVSEVTGRVTDKYLNGSLVFDKNSDDVKYSIIKDGYRIDAGDLEEWNVLSYTVSEDEQLVKAYVSDASVTGSITEISGDEYRIGDSDVLYEKASSYPNEINLRDRGTFYLDIEDKIAAVNTRAGADSAISTNYAYMVDAALKDNFDKTAQFKLFTRAGETVILDSSTKMRLNDDYAKTPEEVMETLAPAGSVTPQLIVYETNSDGKVTAIELAADGTGTGAPAIDKFTKNIQQDDMVYKRASGKLGNVGITEDTIIFDIPAEAGDDTDRYSIRTMATLSNDSTYDAVIYDLQENYAANAVVITSSTGITAAESPITVVSYIAEVQNEDYEYTDKLYGFSGGEEIELPAADKNVFRKSGKPLEAGDIIQYKTNARGEVDGITVLFDSSDKETEFLKNVSTDLTTVYGKVTRKFGGSVNVEVSGNTYNYATGDATVYMFDSARSKNPVSVVSAADIEIYEEDNEARLFVKIYQDEVQEMVIVK